MFFEQLSHDVVGQLWLERFRSVSFTARKTWLLAVDMQGTQVWLELSFWSTVTAHHAQSLRIQACVK
jgi:hypothetical protein